ncbi:ATP-grasp domain-containing protein [Mucilaginibacter sp. SP1R1]|uniref:ATP-grasp domain-containing protein n=1 Tax=Mucilaginibacter sp. SP1R1 TaxID=2723091 RepID=UPI00160E2AE4|nr:ATP-grasp domain-containing protein [Mucilaginibacter sp. SP1R1]MBB6148172.1 carbamoyl-phosphate synthase large subunit [Mucilaginibacter sp. SP1R1]
MTAEKYSCLCIAVTGLNANDNPGPGMAVIRSLKAAFGDGIKIIGLSYESLEPGIYMHEHVKKTYQIPYPTEGSTALFNRLTYVHQQENLDIIIPNFDSELFNFIKIAPQLKRLGIASFLPSHQQLALRDKLNLKDFGAKYDFHVPADHKLFTSEDVKRAADEFNFPMVIKGKFYDAYIVYTIDQALKSFHQLNALWGGPVIAQQFIKGTEINIAALGNGKGNNTSIVAMRKLYITEKGKAWAGVTIKDPKLLELADSFARATHWQGGYEMEIMKNEDGDLYILEVNPRFPAWIYLAVAAGHNQPAALVKMALGEDVTPYGDYQAGKLFIRYSWDHIADIADFQQISVFGEF